MELFEDTDRAGATIPGNAPTSAGAPLAERLRPSSIDEISGQRHLLGPGKPLSTFVERGVLPSMILWGPPGCGKTTLARLLSASLHADFHQLNAVSSGVHDLRAVIERASLSARKLGRRSVLFIDEIHRYNKAQQDALLRSVEDGTLTLIGATTENPSFEVIAPLLSRCAVFTLEPLSDADLGEILDRALAAAAPGRPAPRPGEEERRLLIALADGDARRMLNGLEAALALAPAPAVLDAGTIREAFQTRSPRYDKSGEEHYNVISAFIKSVRGSDPDAAVYWLARMLASGEDPKFIARRMIVLASEDVGNADPSALPLASACFAAVDSIGMPEARIVLAQTAAYLSAAPKSNAAIRAIDAALADARTLPAPPVPLHLRNAPTALMKKMEYGTGYRYPHDAPGAFVEQRYLPDLLAGRRYYEPGEEGREREIRERLDRLWGRGPR